MKRKILFAALLAAASGAQAQATYCRQFDNKTYCSGGVIIHRFGDTTVIPHTTPYQPPAYPALPNVMQQNNSMPTFAAPYSPAGTQNMLPAPASPYLLPVQPAPRQGQMLIAPPGGGPRICHQFGSVLVCN